MTSDVLGLSGSIQDTQQSILQVDSIQQSPIHKITLNYDSDEEHDFEFSKCTENSLLQTISQNEGFIQTQTEYEATQMVQSINPELPHLGLMDQDVQILEQQVQDCSVEIVLERNRVLEVDLVNRDADVLVEGDIDAIGDTIPLIDVDTSMDANGNTIEIEGDETAEEIVVPLTNESMVELDMEQIPQTQEQVLEHSKDDLLEGHVLDRQVSGIDEIDKVTKNATETTKEPKARKRRSSIIESDTSQEDFINAPPSPNLMDVSDCVDKTGNVVLDSQVFGGDSCEFFTAAEVVDQGVEGIVEDQGAENQGSVCEREASPIKLPKRKRPSFVGIDSDSESDEEVPVEEEVMEVVPVEVAEVQEDQQDQENDPIQEQQQEEDQEDPLCVNQENREPNVELSPMKPLNTSTPKKKRKRPSFVGIDSDSSSESDNSNDDDYKPTQKSARVSIGKKVKKTPKSTPKSTPKVKNTQKKYYWIQVPDKEYMIPYELPAGDDPSSLTPVYIQIGQSYLYKKTMSKVLVEEVISNSQFKVRKEGFRSIKVGLEDLLFDLKDVPEKQDLDFSKYGFILSISSQTMRQGHGEQWYFDKDFITQFITQSQGTVITNMIELFHGRSRISETPEQIMVLTHKPLRTKKYLLALAYGIPIINLDWLKESFEANQVLDWEMFRMANGDSLLWNRLAVSHPKPNVADNVPTPDDWSDILRAAGAKIIPKHRITNDIDYVLCDKKPGQKILDVVPPGVTIITGEFVIQCLVHQSILDPSRHEKFTIFG